MRLEGMKNKPRPGEHGIRGEAYIVSAGLKDRPTYTMHSFVEATLAPDPVKGWLHPQWDLMYRCNVTGAQRKFGVIDATEISDRDRSTEEVMQ